MRFERGNPPAISVHPIADALHAVEPQRAARIAIDAGIMARMAVPAATRAHSHQPFAFGWGEFHGSVTKVTHRGRGCRFP